jgi:hypothetical protein
MLEIFIDKILAIFTNGCESGESWLDVVQTRAFLPVCLYPSPLGAEVAGSSHGPV